MDTKKSISNKKEKYIYGCPKCRGTGDIFRRGVAKKCYNCSGTGKMASATKGN